MRVESSSMRVVLLQKRKKKRRKSERHMKLKGEHSGGSA